MVDAPNLRSNSTAGKLGKQDAHELARVKPDDLDGSMWIDRVRVSRAPKGRYLLTETATGKVLARFDLIGECLAEAARYNREAFR